METRYFDSEKKIWSPLQKMSDGDRSPLQEMSDGDQSPLQEMANGDRSPSVMETLNFKLD